MLLRIKRIQIYNYHESRDYYVVLKRMSYKTHLPVKKKNECLLNNNTSRLRINKIERKRKEKEKCHSGAILNISHTV